MLFSWLRRRRRQSILARPFPPDWRLTLERELRHFRHLPGDSRANVEAVVQVMASEKQWVGYDCDVTETMQVVIAGNAALLTLGLGRPFYFDDLPALIVHQDVIVRSAEQAVENPWIGGPGVFLGEMFPRGPVTLSWSAIRREAEGRSPGRNVVLHEFAHYLDGLAGEIDGMPPLPDRRDRQAWSEIAEREYLRLVGHSQRGEATVLDHYGASDRAEFFAVATEAFFEAPHALRQQHAALYDALGRFYRQDPAAWLPESAGDRIALLDSQTTLRPRSSRRRSTFADERRMKAYQQMSTPDALFSIGLDHLAEGRYREATRAFTHLLEADPHDCESYAHRAIARYHLGRPQEALSDCDHALALDPDDVDALTVRALVLLDQGAVQEGLDELHRAVALAPRDPDIRLHRGRAYCLQGNWRRAIDDLSESIAADPYQAEAFVERAKAYRALGQLARADADLEKARLLDPEVDVLL